MANIVPVPDPITGGAGAPVMVANIVNAMWNNAGTMAKAGELKSQAAAALAVPAPTIPYVYLDMSYPMPLPPVLEADDPNRFLGLYEEEMQKMYDMITQNFAAFIDKYFPHPEMYEHAMQWCDNAVVHGGSGINVNVERALVERDRARIYSDSMRAEDEFVSKWAGRRWPIPVGPMVAGVNDITLDANRKLAESSRTVMIQSWKDELENIKFAVKILVDQYKVALDAAGEYVKVLMMGPNIAMQLTTGLSGLKTQFANAMTALYAAQVNALDPLTKLHITDATLRMEVNKANQASYINSIDEQVKAAMMAAQMYASMAASGINGVNAQASVQGSDSTQIPYGGGISP